MVCLKVMICYFYQQLLKFLTEKWGYFCLNKKVIYFKVCFKSVKIRWRWGLWGRDKTPSQVDEAPRKETWKVQSWWHLKALYKPGKCYENMAIDNIFAIIASVGLITIWDLVQKTIFKYWYKYKYKPQSFWQEFQPKGSYWKSFINWHFPYFQTQTPLGVSEVWRRRLAGEKAP